MTQAELLLPPDLIDTLGEPSKTSFENRPRSAQSESSHPTGEPAQESTFQ
jgi:hypothetical protein